MIHWRRPRDIKRKSLSFTGRASTKNGWRHRDFFGHRARRAGDLKKALAVMRSPDFNLRTETVVEGTVHFADLADRRPKLPERGDVQVLGYRLSLFAHQNQRLSERQI